MIIRSLTPVSPPPPFGHDGTEVSRKDPAASPSPGLLLPGLQLQESCRCAKGRALPPGPDTKPAAPQQFLAAAALRWRGDGGGPVFAPLPRLPEKRSLAALGRS
jgi:hypothetical protein